MKPASRVYLRALARISHIHREVVSAGYPSVAKLSEMLEVHERTIKRDLAFLRDELNAPLKFDRSKKGFCYSIENWSLPPQRLTEGDLLAFFIAENALKLTGQDAHALQLKNSLAKIASLLPEQVAVDLASLGENVRFQNTPFVTVSPETLKTVANSSIGMQTIEFDYYSPKNDETTHRRADVYLLQNFAGDWYAISYDHGRRDYRDFHIGRMSNLRTTDRYFVRRKDWDPETYLKRGFTMTRGGRLTRVVISFDKYQARWIRERKHFHPDEAREELPDGGLRLSFKIGEAALEAVARFCMTYAGNCIAEQPKKLRELIREKAKKACESHEF